MLLARNRVKVSDRVLFASQSARRVFSSVLPASNQLHVEPDFSPVPPAHTPPSFNVNPIQSLDQKLKQFGVTNAYSVMATFKRVLAEAKAHPDKSVAHSNPEKTLSLYERQIKIEMDQYLAASEERIQLIKNLQSVGQSTSTSNVKRNLVTWYQPMMDALLAEGQKIERRESGVDRSIYGPYLLTLPPSKVAVVTLDTVIGAILRNGNAGVKIAVLLSEIGSLLEIEYNMEKLRQLKNMEDTYAKQKLKELRNNKNKKEVRALYRSVKRIISDKEPWSLALKAKIGGFLLETLVREVKLEGGEPVFTCSTEFNPRSQKRASVLFMTTAAFNSVDESQQKRLVFPRLLPMLVPPQPWNNRQYYGAYIHLRAPLMKHYTRSQMEIVQKANIKTVLEGLDYLGSTPWRINKEVYDVITQALDRGMLIGEIPSRENVALPKEEDFMVPGEGENAAPQVDRVLYNQMTKRVLKRNAELHSLRCDMHIKLSIAQQFMNDVIFFPHNMDFRGRAYPVPPNLSHIGSDLCRGLLRFAVAKEVGPEGLRWLKIHLANLWGINKISFEDRVAWVDENMSNVLESAQRPLDGNMWWAKAESPFQALATCYELANAYALDDPTTYRCSLPVHQDGSCNGLQHYAGIGRDELGGKAVNLVPSDSPQDVYTKVLEIVSHKLSQDELIPEDHEDPMVAKNGHLARLVRPVLSRKVIKQTVMTSVYGVTPIGAKNQIRSRLEEHFTSNGAQSKRIMTPAVEQEIDQAAKYLAKTTLESLREMFKSAKEIMDWLADASNLVSNQGCTMSWMTPLNLPVTQPYRRQARHSINTVLQRVVLALNSDYLPVESRKQKSAFPPNFVHSLDATHMLLTSLRMKERGLSFAAVHDSFWTHPSDAPILAQCLRESFVELYEYPILENLRDSIARRFPHVQLPELPKRGSLEIREVTKSKYFFH